MARRSILMQHVAAVTADIVVEYARELQGLAYEENAQYHLVAAYGNDCVGAHENFITYMRGWESCVTVGAIHSLLVLRNGDVACGLVNCVNIYRGTQVATTLDCGKGPVSAMAELHDGRLVTVSGCHLFTWNLSANPPSRTIRGHNCHMTALLAF